MLGHAELTARKTRAEVVTLEFLAISQLAIKLMKPQHTAYQF